MNTNKLSRSLHQELILLFDLNWDLQLCTCDLNTVLGLVCTLMNSRALLTCARAREIEQPLPTPTTLNTIPYQTIPNHTILLQGPLLL